MTRFVTRTFVYQYTDVRAFALRVPVKTPFGLPMWPTVVTFRVLKLLVLTRKMGR